MKITDKSLVDVNQSQHIKDNQAVSPARDKGSKRETERSGEAAQVSISPEARQLQRVAALAERGDELRAEKVKKLKEQIEQGAYRVDAADVAKGVVRSEVSRLLGEK